MSQYGLFVEGSSRIQTSNINTLSFSATRTTPRRGHCTTDLTYRSPTQTECCILSQIPPNTTYINKNCTQRINIPKLRNAGIYWDATKFHKNDPIKPDLTQPMTFSQFQPEHWRDTKIMRVPRRYKHKKIYKWAYDSSNDLLHATRPKHNSPHPIRSDPSPTFKYLSSPLTRHLTRNATTLYKY